MDSEQKPFISFITSNIITVITRQGFHKDLGITIIGLQHGKSPELRWKSNLNAVLVLHFNQQGHMRESF